MNRSDPPRRKANFFLVGAPKCGTTAWFEYLRTHPDVFIPALKEPSFFSSDLPNFRRVSSEAEYGALFAEAGGAKVLADASALYLFSNTAAQAIRAYNPAAKILIFLRDQEEYLPSLHNQHLTDFSDDVRDFERAWRLSGRRPLTMVPAACAEPRTLDYAALGRFGEQVGRYLAAFPREQIMVVRFRDWVADPRSSYLAVLDFLGLEDDGRTEFPQVHEGITYRSRGLVRFLLYPPQIARSIARVAKRAMRIQPRTIVSAAEKTVTLLSVAGYKKKISPELREEIRCYYADDNRLLAEQLQSLGVLHPRRRSAAEADVARIGG